MKQSFVEIQAVSGIYPMDPHDLLARALKGAFQNIAMTMEHGEFYADPHREMISGWRQQRLDLTTFGQWLEYDIKVRLGAAHDPYCVNPVMRVDATVDDGIDQ